MSATKRNVPTLLLALAMMACAVLGLALIMIGGSLFADARSENLAGPGVDVFALECCVAPGGQARLLIEARGGDRAGIGRVIATDEAGRTIAEGQGQGATWGYE